MSSQLSPEYRIWSGMIQRCHNPNGTGFKLYGGRGIRVCDEWRKSFSVFLAHVGPKPSPSHSIDRIDPNGHYQPGNVRWSTPKEQQRNRRDNRNLTFNGETRCVSEWAEVLGIHANTILFRLENGWTVEESLSVAVGERKHPGPKPKLNNEAIAEILRRVGGETQTALAKEFGVNQSVISRVLNGKAWGHVNR